MKRLARVLQSKNLYFPDLIFLFILMLLFGFIFWGKDQPFTQNAFYHLKLAKLYGSFETTVDSFRSFKSSYFSDSFVNQHFLYHLFLVPFTYIFKGIHAISMANAFMLVVMIMAIMKLLRTIGVRHSYIWATIIPFLQLLAYRRFVWHRPEPLAFAFFVLFSLMLISRKRVSWLFWITLLYQQFSYFSFMFVPLALIMNLVDYGESKKWNWRPVLFTAAGFLAGFLISLNPIDNFLYFWNMTMHNTSSGVSINEWKIAKNFFKFYLLYIAFISIAFTFLITFTNRIRRHHKYLMIVSLMFFILTAKAMRFEYLFAGFSSFLILSILPQLHIGEHFKRIGFSKILEHKVISLLVVLCFSFGIYQSVSNLTKIKTKFFGHKKEIYNTHKFYNWYKKSEYSGQPFINYKWEYWSELFFYDHQIPAAPGYSTFIYEITNPEAVKLYDKLRRNYKKLNHETLKGLADNLKAKYLLVDKKSKFGKMVGNGKNNYRFNNYFSLLYQDENVKFLEINPRMLDSVKEYELRPGQYQLILIGSVAGKKFDLSVRVGSNSYDFGKVGKKFRTYNKSFRFQIEKPQKLVFLSGKKKVYFHPNQYGFNTDDGLSKHNITVNDDFFFHLKKVGETVKEQKVPLSDPDVKKMISYLLKDRVIAFDKFSQESLKFLESARLRVQLIGRQGEYLGSYWSSMQGDLKSKLTKLAWRIKKKKRSHKNLRMIFSLLVNKETLPHIYYYDIDNSKGRYAVSISAPNKREFIYSSLFLLISNWNHKKLFFSLLKKLDLKKTMDHKIHRYRQYNYFYDGKKVALANRSGVFKDLNRYELKQSLSRAVDFLSFMQEKNGQFNYVYQARKGSFSNKKRAKNSIRMASGASALCYAIESKITKHDSDRCKRAVEYLVKSYSEKNDGMNSLGELSIVGMTLISYRNIFKDYRYDKLLRSIRKSVEAYYDKANGRFNTHQDTVNKKSEFFYPGEALTFIKRYELSFKRKLPIDYFEKTFDYYSSLYKKTRNIFMYRWFGEAYSYASTRNRDVKFKAVVERMIDDISGKFSSNPYEDGCLTGVKINKGRIRYPSNMTATALEGLVHYLSTGAPNKKHKRSLKRMLNCAVYQQHSVVSASNLKKPGEALGGVPYSVIHSNVGIDVQSHYIGALVDFYRLGKELL